jgi:hypothetical protein
MIKTVITYKGEVIIDSALRHAKVAVCDLCKSETAIHDALPKEWITLFMSKTNAQQWCPDCAVRFRDWIKCQPELSTSELLSQNRRLTEKLNATLVADEELGFANNTEESS